MACVATGALLILAGLIDVSVPAVAVASEAGALSKYIAVAPARILDTRSGVGAPKGRPAAGATVNLQVSGSGGVPGTGATAVTLNLVVTNPTQLGYVQALPSTSGTLGASSNINIYYPGQTAANLVTVPVGPDGGVRLYDVAGGDLIADVLGYFSATATSTDGRYTAQNPTRIVDSRTRVGLPVITPPPTPANPGDTVNCTSFSTWSEANTWFWTYYPYYGDVARLDGNNDLIPCESLPGVSGTPVIPPPPPPFNPYPIPPAGETFQIQLTGNGGIPASGVSSVALTVTATQSAGAGFVQVVPTGGPTALGTTSNVNLSAAGQTVANLVIVPVGTGGTVQLYNSSGTHLIVDIVGYFTDSTQPVSDAGLFVPVDPARLMDTRATQQPTGGSQTLLNPLGMAGVPSTGVSAVFLNPTAVQTTGPGYLQLFPTGLGTAGASSSLNFTSAGQTIANAAIGTLGTGGNVTIYTPTATHVLVDIFGYFTGTSSAGAGTADAILSSLTIAAKNTAVAYDRTTWNHWIDADNDCQDTRQEVLIAESTTTPVLDATGCTVVSGTWVDPYSGQTWTLPSDLDVDHVVPLKNAHDSGGWAWDLATKEDYANNLNFADHLIAVQDNLNQAKGDSGPETWKPPLTADWCSYATDWVTIKATWSLTITLSEHDALSQMLATC